MLGVALGDIVGAPYELKPHKSTVFPLFAERTRFTDDTELSVAVADALLGDRDYGAALRRWGRRYPDAGYGGTFVRWLIDPDMGPYGSWGNGAAMRVAPIGWAFDDEATVLLEAERSAMPTHDHPEGVKGAQAVALAVFMARRRVDRGTMRRELSARFGYDLERKVEAVRPDYRFDVSCQGSVPEALLASSGVEDAVRIAVSLGGDADTQAAIAGAVAEAWYGGVPPGLEAQVLGRLDEAMRDVIARFGARFMGRRQGEVADRFESPGGFAG